MKALPQAIATMLKTALVIAVALVVVTVVGLWVAGVEESRGPSPSGRVAGTNVAVWTCSMHPQIRSDKPGACPICGMPLVPMTSRGDASAAGIVLPETGRRVAQIETLRLARAPAVLEQTLLARFAFEEQRVAALTAWIGGRVERVHVPSVGAIVAPGAPLVDLYTPELLAAREELRAAARASDPTLLSALRERFRRFGLTDSQIDGFLGDAEPNPRATLYAPIGGVVTDRPVEVGAMVAEGDLLFRIASLDPLLVELDVYERDLALVRPGTKFSLAVDALPGKTFDGSVEYLKPTLDEATRTTKARATVRNPGSLARPGMYGRATLRVPIGADGQPLGFVAMETGEENPVPQLPSTVPAPPVRPVEASGVESVPPTNPAALPLLLPASALLDLGARRLVYVEREGDRYEPVEVVLGPRVGDSYVVLAGLDEGDAVVVRGAFLVDSQTQIEGKPSLLFERGAGVEVRAGHEGHR